MRVTCEKRRQDGDDHECFMPYDVSIRFFVGERGDVELAVFNALLRRSRFVGENLGVSWVGQDGGRPATQREGSECGEKMGDWGTGGLGEACSFLVGDGRSLESTALHSKGFLVDFRHSYRGIE